MITKKSTTDKAKTIRVLKYIAFYLVCVVVLSMADAIIYRFFTDPWIDFKNDHYAIYGAMAYRLISTWDYE